MNTELLTIKEMQNFLRISRSKAYELTKIKGFPQIKLGKAIRINKQELLNWLKN